MKTSCLFRGFGHLSALAWCASVCTMANAATIFQSSGSSYIAFQGESVSSIIAGTPTSWVITNDATANGGKAIYEAGANQTGSSSSFAYYSLAFTQPGTYTLYYRWRADKAYTDVDPNSANSFRVPVDFGDLPNDSTSTNFVTASVNNAVAVPAANSYNVFKDSHTFTVTQAELDAGAPLIFKIGTREAGMFIDRFVLSTNDSLAEADFNALADSDTEVVIQGASDSFLAFQGERVGKIDSGTATNTSWVITNDATANGGKAIYEAGANQTASSSSFAYYSLGFVNPGTYTLYYRWRADKAYTDVDPNSANSFRVPIDFGDLPNDTTSSNFVTASVNNAVAVPAANSYNVFKDGHTFTVTPDELTNGAPLIFKIGTREAGMFIDRFIFSTNDSLTEADINALPDSGSRTPPKVLKAVGSASLNTVTVSFDEPLATSATNLSNFSISGNVTVLGALLNTNTSRDIILTTSPQVAGSNYVVTINGVQNVTGDQIAANSTVRFTAWTLATGWVTREFYLNLANTAGGVDDLLAAPNFPDSPDIVDVAKGFQINNDITGNNYGARLRAFFIPPTSGMYEFFVYDDDAARLSLSTDQTAANLALLVDSPNIQTNFDTSVMGTSPSLTAGQKYLLEVLYRQNTGSALLGVAVRKQGDTTPPASLPILGGALIATYINPDLGAINITQEPTDASVSAFSRARFTVKATTLGPTLYYQWQLNGADIPGATRATYVTPVLSTSDSGKTYDVVLSAAGNSVTSAIAHLTVVPGTPPPQQPYIGVNFVGTSAANSGGGSGGILSSNDVAGVVPQENFNNITDTTAAADPLDDNTGAPTPVTISYDSLSNVTTGTGDSDADHALFQGYIHNNNAPMTVTLGGVPPGTNYSLILYSVGFNFNTTYEEAYDLTGAKVYPTLHVQAQDASQYIASPGYVRMSSTDPNARDHGNYVQYDNISPAADGSLTIVITPESTNTGISYLPPLNALQLIKVTPGAVTTTPTLRATFNRATGMFTITWTTDATGFTLQSSSTVGASASWSPVSGAPNPISAAGSIDIALTSTSVQFYRLKK